MNTGDERKGWLVLLALTISMASCGSQEPSTSDTVVPTGHQDGWATDGTVDDVPTSDDEGNAPPEPDADAVASVPDTVPVPVTSPVRAQETYEVKLTEDISYGQGLARESWEAEDGTPVDLLLDVYRPEGAPAEGKPALVVIHGGGFLQGSHKQPVLMSFCSYFASRGWVAISLTYRVAESHGSLPDAWPVDLGPVLTTEQARALYPAGRDAKAAVRWLRAHETQLGIDPDSVVALGGSAGAFLSLLLGVSNDDDYTTELTLEQDPTLETTHLEQSSEVQVVIDLWGGTGLLDALESFDGESRFDAGDAPVAILHGTEDTSVPFTEAEAIRQRYDETGAPYLWSPLEGEGHSAWTATVEGQSLAEVAYDFATEHLGLEVIP